MKEETLYSEGGEHSWVERAGGWRLTQLHTGAGVYGCAVLLKEVFLNHIRTSVNTQPTVFFPFPDQLCQSALTVFMSQSLSLFLWGCKLSVSLPCNRCHCPTCVAASVIETNRIDERELLLSLCSINFLFRGRWSTNKFLTMLKSLTQCITIVHDKCTHLAVY